MKRIAPIRLEYDPKTLWFDPGDLDIKKDDPVVVRTARGEEFGEAASDIIEVEDEQVEELKSPLAPVLRIADEDDFAQRDEMRRLSREALPIFRELAAETNKEMHPIMVEYLFDGSKAIFLFDSEERSDFRSLVRRLGSRLHVRVDMRQIGVRDEARIVGGYGHCGQELCCRRLGGEFCPVSIRMAKAQDLSLNPVQISGVCGRLMCCLRYEYDIYKDFKARAPKPNATIHTPEGDFKVGGLDMPREEVILRIDKNKRVRIPLSAFDPVPEDAESKRPNTIGEAYYTYAQGGDISMKYAPTMDETARFTRDDKLAEKGVVHHNPVRKKEKGAQDKDAGSATSSRRRRSRGSRHVSNGAPRERGAGDNKVQEQRAKAQKQVVSKQPASANANANANEAANGHRRRRRRRVTSGQAAGQAPSQTTSQSSAAKSAPQGASNAAPSHKGGASPKGTQSTHSASSEANGHRRTRRRSHKMGGPTNDGQ